MTSPLNPRPLKLVLKNETGEGINSCLDTYSNTTHVYWMKFVWVLATAVGRGVEIFRRTLDPRTVVGRASSACQRRRFQLVR